MSFIVLTKDQFEDILPNSYEEIDVKGCKEYVYQVDTKNENINVRIYSTVDKGTNQTRDKGTDAIRIVYWAVRTDRPIGKGKKILRVEGATTIQERISSRIEEFLNEAHAQDDNFIDPLYIEAILTHPSIQWNSFAKSLYEGFLEYGNLTERQLVYVIGETNPKGKLTFEGQCKSKNPDFYQDFLDALGNEEVEEETNEYDDIFSKDTTKDEPFKPKENAAREKYKNKETTNEEPSGLDPIFITSDGMDVTLVPTKDYEPYQYPFEFFNPVQSISLPYKDDNINMIISANTSAGKTIAVEPMIDATLKDNKKVLYLAPLKALVSEKFDDWQVRFPDKKISILTGDYVLTEKMKLELNTADIIVLTSEMLDSYTYETELYCHKNGAVWIDTIGNIVENNIDCEVFSYHPNKGVQPTKITDRIKIGKRDVYEVTLAGKRKVRMTESHNLFTIGDDNEPVEKKLKHFHVGDYAALSQGFKTPSTISTIPILDILLTLPTKELERLYVHGEGITTLLDMNATELASICPLGSKTEPEPIGTQRRKNYWVKVGKLPLSKVKLLLEKGIIAKDSLTHISMYHSKETLPTTINVDVDLAKSIAIFLADGNTAPNCAEISQKDHPELLRIAQRAFGGNIISAGKNKGEILQVNKLWNRVFKTFGHLAKNKVIPDFLYTWEYEKIVAFIKGFLQTDGTYGERRDRFYSSSKEIVTGIQKLLILIGRQSTVSQNKNNIYEVTTVQKTVKQRNHYHPHLIYTKITDIQYVGVENVYDIEVQPKELAYKVENFIGGQGGILLHNSRTRKMESEQNFFLKMAGLLLVDEAHVLTMPKRGHAMETAMMRFSSINSYCRIILISATMPNVKELGEWLTVLNTKQSVVIHCNWRPVELQLHFKEHPLLTKANRWPDYWGTQDAKKEMAIDIAMQKPDEMFLIFAHDKATGRDLIKKFKKVGESVVFHNADLEKEKRKELEANFRNRKQRIMISTSTTAFGLNLPARNVIILGTHRGIKDVDPLEIIQEIGRAGRYGLDDEGHAFIIVPKGTRGSWKHAILNPRPVNSVLNCKEVLAFHALAEIANKVITDERSLLTWYERSLAGKQNIIPFSERDAKALFDDLSKMEMIRFQGIQPYVTGLGKVSSGLYFSPFDVHCWYCNFEKIYNGGVPLDDMTLAWALTDIPSNNPGYVVSSMKSTAEDWRYRLRNRGVHCSDAILSVIAAYEQLTGQTNGVGGVINVLKRSIAFDIDRVKQALSRIDSLHAKWNQDKLWEVLSPRIKYGVPLEMIDLVRVPGIGATRAKKLWDQNIQSPEDIVKANMSTLKSILGANIASKAKIGAAKMMSAF
jgi:replicative superfamily II helicase